MRINRRILRRDAAREQKATAGSIKVFESRTTLFRRIARFRKIQAIYMPIVPGLLVSTSTSTTTSIAASTTASPPAITPTADTAAVAAALPSPMTSPSSTVVSTAKESIELAENICLMLSLDILKAERDGLPPSKTVSDSSDNDSDNDNNSLSIVNRAADAVHQAATVAWREVTAQRETRHQNLASSFVPDLMTAEMRLRRAQCCDALKDLCTKLHMRSHFRQYKRLNVRNQTWNMRANDALAKIEFCLHRAANKYRAACDALWSLVGGYTEWAVDYLDEFSELKHTDIQQFDDDDPSTKRKKKNMRKTAKKQVAEGSRKVSWIWRGANTTDSEGISPGAWCFLQYTLYIDQ